MIHSRVLTIVNTTQCTLYMYVDKVPLRGGSTHACKDIHPHVASSMCALNQALELVLIIYGISNVHLDDYMYYCLYKSLILYGMS